MLVGSQTGALEARRETGLQEAVQLEASGEKPVTIRKQKTQRSRHVTAC